MRNTSQSLIDLSVKWNKWLRIIRISLFIVFLLIMWPLVRMEFPLGISLYTFLKSLIIIRMLMWPLVRMEFPLRISLYTFLKSLMIDMIKHVTIIKNGISLYTFLKSLIIKRTLKHMTISKNRISLKNFLVHFFKKFNNRHALRIRLIGLNK